MRAPSFNILIGAGLAAIAAFQPIIVVTTDQVMLPPSVAWGLVFWGAVAVVASAYNRKKTEIACVAVLIAANPFMTKFLNETDIQQRFNLRNVVEYGQGAFICWGAAACIIGSLLSKDKSEQPAAGDANTEK